MAFSGRSLAIACAFFSAITLASPQPTKAPSLDPKKLQLASVSALVIDVTNGRTLYEKNPQAVVPIASVTKLMTAVVVLDAKQNLDEMITVDENDRDTLKSTWSRIRFGTQVSRRDALLLALMSSENRMASALGRHYPGGLQAFVAAMNRKAKTLGMNDTRYADATGLSSENVSTARDLALLVGHASGYPLIRDFSTRDQRAIRFAKPNYGLQFFTTNPLVKNDNWQVSLQKTGYTSEAGRCVVMMAKPGNRELAIVLLDSHGKRSPLGDAGRIRKWLQGINPGAVPAEAAAYAKQRQRQLDGLTASR